MGSDVAGQNALVAAATAELRLLGVLVTEDANVDGKVIVHHGTGTGDPAVLPIRVPAHRTVVIWLPDDGLDCPNGLYLQRVTSTTHVVVFRTIGSSKVSTVKILPR